MDLNLSQSQVWWHVPLMPALGKQKKVHLYESEARTVCIESSRTAKTYIVRPCLKGTKNKIK